MMICRRRGGHTSETSLCIRSQSMLSLTAPEAARAEGTWAEMLETWSEPQIKEPRWADNLPSSSVLPPPVASHSSFVPSRPLHPSSPCPLHPSSSRLHPQRTLLQVGGDHVLMALLMLGAAGTCALCLLCAQQWVYWLGATLRGSWCKQLCKWESFRPLVWAIMQ